VTVVVGFVGDDGAVMASDSEATEPAASSRFDVEKIWAVGGLMLGYTGNDAIRQPLVVAIETAITNAFDGKEEIDRWEAREVLQTAIGPVLRHCYPHYVGPVATGRVPDELAGALLVVGRDANGYWMLSVNETNTATFHEEHGFHTVGSGSPAAYVGRSMMNDYAPLGRSVAHLKLMAYRIVDTCIDTVSGVAGVGGEVRLWYSQGGRPFTKAATDEMEATASWVNEWRGAERESLDLVLGQGPEPAGGDELDLPEAIDAEETADNGQ
jgi:hypothetical protein